MKIDNYIKLKSLKAGDTFVFDYQNSCSYKIVSNDGETVVYRRIPRHEKDNKNILKELDKKYLGYSSNHIFNKVYSVTVNYDVLTDYLPF